MEFETIRTPGPYGAGKGIAANLSASAGIADMRIAAGRFVLRPVRASDAGLIAHYAGDKRVAEATQGIPHPLPPGACGF